MHLPNQEHLESQKMTHPSIHPFDGGRKNLLVKIFCAKDETFGLRFGDAELEPKSCWSQTRAGAEIISSSIIIPSNHNTFQAKYLSKGKDVCYILYPCSFI